MSTRAQSKRNAFQIVVVCALPLEYDAVYHVFDEVWNKPSDDYGKAPGDSNIYAHGLIDGHAIVLTLLSGMGKASSGTAAVRMKSSYPNLKMALIVGICGAVPKDPRNGEDIHIGDVIFSKFVVQYDFGRQYADKFEPKRNVEDSLGRPSKDIRTICNFLETQNGRDEFEDTILKNVKLLQKRSRQASHTEIYEAPDSYNPCIRVGGFASGDAVMKSAVDRDRIAKEQNIVAFEMEGAGIWDELPSVIIKGVCDFADASKCKEYQNYASATSASAAKALLKYIQIDKSNIDSTGWSSLASHFTSLQTSRLPYDRF